MNIFCFALVSLTVNSTTEINGTIVSDVANTNANAYCDAQTCMHCAQYLFIEQLNHEPLSCFISHTVPRFPADVREGTDSPAVELVATARAHDLKVECLIELAQVLRHKAQSHRHLTVSWYNPPEYSQSTNMYTNNK